MLKHVMWSMWHVIHRKNDIRTLFSHSNKFEHYIYIYISWWRYTCVYCIRHVFSDTFQSLSETVQLRCELTWLTSQSGSMTPWHGHALRITGTHYFDGFSSSLAKMDCWTNSPVVSVYFTLWCSCEAIVTHWVLNWCDYCRSIWGWWQREIWYIYYW